MKYNKMPLEFIGITTEFNINSYPKHYGLDLGWNEEYGGKNAKIYAINDGVVIDKGFNNSAGNYIWIETVINDTKFLHRYLHMNQTSPLKINDKVIRGDVVGNMGNTGDSSGNHLHFELWKCPKNYSLNWSDRDKYVVNPLNYVYLFDDQKTNTNEVTRVIGTSLIKERDKTKRQVQVNDYLLRVRTSPNKDILGYIDYGIYDILEEEVNGEYTWLKIDANKWIAKTENVTILEKEGQGEKEKEEEEKPEDFTKEYKKFTATKKGIYYIELNSGDSVYYKS